MKKEDASLVEKSRRALDQAVQETLETLIFSEAIPLAADSQPRFEQPVYVTSVAVKRPYAGSLRLIMSRDVAVAFVEAMLGSAGQVEEAWLQDGLAELANTVGGRMLAYLLGGQSSFDLGASLTQMSPSLPVRAPGAVLQQFYRVNEACIVVEVELQLLQAA